MKTKTIVITLAAFAIIIAAGAVAITQKMAKEREAKAREEQLVAERDDAVKKAAKFLKVDDNPLYLGKKESPRGEPQAPSPANPTATPLPR